MFFRMMLLVWEFGLEWAAVSRMTDREKDLGYSVAKRGKIREGGNGPFFAAKSYQAG
jgi:hypothetical protein